MKLGKREKKILLELQHENIVTIYSTQECEAFYYLAMERCNSNLANFFDSVLKEEIKVKDILIQTATGVQYLHDKQFSKFNLALICLSNLTLTVAIKKKYCTNKCLKFGLFPVHCDIKPENILLKKFDKIWKVKISDFGISKKLEGSNTSSTMTVDNLVIHDWTAPEYIQKKENVSSFSFCDSNTLNNSSYILE